MNVVVLSAEFPSSSWRRSFADTLIRLRPDMNPDAADELSDSAFLTLGDLEPGDAAALCSQGNGALASPAQAAQTSLSGRGK